MKEVGFVMQDLTRPTLIVSLFVTLLQTFVWRERVGALD